MTNSPAKRQLLEAARDGHVPYALLQDTANQSAQLPPDLLDELSYWVASQYSSHEMDFECADMIMNGLWSACFSEGYWVDFDRTIPPATNAIFMAFDAGEYRRASDPPDTDPELKYTRPLIDAILAEREQPGNEK